jgi:ribosomal protein S18 acetylase RimI-like enzyme
MNIEIKKLSPESWQQYRDIRLRSTECDPKAFAETPQDVNSRSEEEWKLFIQNMWFAVTNGIIIGTVGLLQDKPTQTAHIVSFWVDPAHRGKKIGTRLIQHLIEIAKPKDIKKLALTVTETQLPAIALYESLGFKIIDRLKDAACYGDNCYDQLLMELRLD